MLLYSENPRTSSLVLMTIKGLLSVDYIPRATADDQKFTQLSDIYYEFVSIIRK